MKYNLMLTRLLWYPAFISFALLMSGCTGVTPEISIIPLPVKCQLSKGSFRLSSSTVIYYSPDDKVVMNIAGQFSSLLSASLGAAPAVEVYNEKRPQTGNILFRLSAIPADLGEEGYRLDVGRKGILVESNTLRGLFNGMQTLRQLIPLPKEEADSAGAARLSIPCVSVTDRPRFSWRGVHLDVSRHFFPVDFIKKYIDYLALYKMNYFHWHLVDDQGWRIEIKKYPRLTGVGAWRVDRENLPWNERPPQQPGETATYGGFYTQDEIRDIVNYAADRFITVVPEIEMPAHGASALAAYPEYSCTGIARPVPPGGLWPLTNLYCAGNDAAFEFIEDILTEVMDLFPSEYIHIGGDEATMTEWEKCPKCRTRMRTEKLKDVRELQSYFIRRIEAFLDSKGRKLIGWDEILEGGLAPRATVMSWRGMRGGIEAARQGHDVVMTPTSHCYFDYYQGLRKLEPPAIGGWVPLSTVYAFEPVPEELTPEESVHILGAQANMWTEYIATPDHCEYMLFPRLTALSEVVWTPAEQKNWNNFASRVLRHMKRWDNMGINYAKSALNVTFKAGLDSISGNISAVLKTEIPLPEIRYTTDGTEPTQQSALYGKPILITRNMMIKANSFMDGVPAGKIDEQSFTVHLATGSRIETTNPYSQRYSAGGDYGLTNGIRGSLDHLDGHWQGYEGVDFDARLMLDSVRNVSKISVGFLNKTDSWIFLPLSIGIEISEDGQQFTETKITRSISDLNNPKTFVRDFQVLFDAKPARYIRIKARNTGTVPDWHAGAGGKAWLFVDEIIVE